MKNEILGFLLFFLLIIGATVGLYFDQLHFYGVLGLALGLGIILIFRKKH